MVWNSGNLLSPEQSPEKLLGLFGEFRDEVGTIDSRTKVQRTEFLWPPWNSWIKPLLDSELPLDLQ